MNDIAILMEKRTTKVWILKKVLDKIDLACYTITKIDG